VGGCSAGRDGGPRDPEPPSPFADCAALAGPPAGAGPSAVAGVPSETGSPSGPAGAGVATGPARDPATVAAGNPGVARLPDGDLPCFTGGTAVALGQLRGPAVVNLWASWCPPCREELPAFQRLADRTAGRLHVIGVNTRDRRESARSLAVDLGLTLPNLIDQDERLRTGLGRAALPVTAFVDGQGRIRHLHDAGALDDATLERLVQQHLGVATGP
jgi:thiol-disulfide isomerase/thioredoxin